jgi:hypothetical protein
VIDIPEDGAGRRARATLRQEAIVRGVPYYTTLDGAQAVLAAIEALLKSDPEPVTLQERHRARPQDRGTTTSIDAPPQRPVESIARAVTA